MKSCITLLFVLFAFSVANAQNAARVVREDAEYPSVPSFLGNWHLIGGHVVDYSYSGNHGSYFGALHTALLHQFDTAKFKEKSADIYEAFAKVGWNVFDNNGNVIEQYWVAGKVYSPLENHTKYLFAYSSGMLEKANAFYWDKASQSWMPESRTVYSYNVLNKLSEKRIDGWDNASAAWQNDRKYDYVYNTAGQLQDYTEYRWYNNGWQKNQKVACLYKGNYHRGSYVQNWNYINGAIGKGYLSNAYGYDGNGNLQYDTSFGENGSIVKRWTNSYNNFNQPVLKLWQYLNHSTGKWVTGMDFHKYEYTYEAFTNAVDDAKGDASVIQVYPSPANNMLHISSTGRQWNNVSISIADLAGRTFALPFQRKGDSSFSADVSELACGLYVIRLDGPNWSASELVAVQH